MTTDRAWLWVPLAAVALSVAHGFSPAVAQSPTKPSFEVASVKPNKSDRRGMSWSAQPGGRFSATNISLAMIIRNAFGLQESQLVGVPDWGMSEGFDVVAKAEQEFPGTNERPSVVQLMVQSLLEERFKLVSHRETRELPAYALVVARADGTLGPGLKQSDVDCLALAAARRAGAAAPPRPEPGQRRPCTMMMAGGTLRAASIPMSSLAATLSSPTQRMVVDRTGLKGNFDFDLSYSTEPSADTSSPSLFTALQEQLGLKLESVRVPTDVLVIDSVERPTPD
jgi:uncharacterized protein (TIGR03435 family)